MLKYSHLVTKHNTKELCFSENRYIRLISVDPGIKNFAFRIETRYSDGRKPETVAMRKIDFSIFENSNMYYESIQLLNQYSHLFSTVNVVLVEEQLPFNYKMVRMSQHILSYFIIKTPHAMILEVNSKLKSKQLNAPQHLNEKQIKKWSVEKAKEILIEREDLDTLSLINNTAKKDDLSDTIIQIEAICSLYNWN